MKINFNSFNSFSTIDYTDKVCCVVFLNGCNCDCQKCHNKQTLTDKNYIDIEIIKKKILESKPFIHTVIFSGGEPTLQIKPLYKLCKFSKENGFNVGIETNGINTIGINLIKEYVDMFFIDVKAPLNKPDEYFNTTSFIYACKAINETLKLNIAYEIRIVNFDELKTLEIIKSLPYGTNFKILKENKNIKQ